MNRHRKTLTGALAAILLTLFFQPAAEAQKKAKPQAMGAHVATDGQGTVITREKADSLMPVRGFCIDAPQPAGVDSFLQFIDKELAPRQVNTLLLLIDYHYQFKSHPELADTLALSEAEAKKIVA
ncbi:MAG TPA: hypothetical protein VE035_06780, partial [Puia sp.]|nr:hypothetical protein [Puia sp.]